MQQSTRYPELDLLRTVAIVLMVIYHFAFDLRFFYDVPLDVLHGPWLVLQRITANLFLLLVGIGAAISLERHRSIRHILRRFVIVAGGALLVTGATYVADPQSFVRFGILHLIALSALLLPLLSRLREGTILLGLLTLFASDAILSVLPPSVWLIPIGSPPPHFQTVDYFPFLPWFSTILIGYGLGHLLYIRFTLWRDHFPMLHTQYPIRNTLLWPGRHSLPLYLIHQPLILLALWMTWK